RLPKEQLGVSGAMTASLAAGGQCLLVLPQGLVAGRDRGVQLADDRVARMGVRQTAAENGNGLGVVPLLMQDAAQVEQAEGAVGPLRQVLVQQTQVALQLS